MADVADVADVSQVTIPFAMLLSGELGEWGSGEGPFGVDAGILHGGGGGRSGGSDEETGGGTRELFGLKVKGVREGSGGDGGGGGYGGGMAAASSAAVLGGVVFGHGAKGGKGAVD